jgi:hypothetical protein
MTKEAMFWPAVLIGLALLLASTLLVLLQYSEGGERAGEGKDLPADTARERDAGRVGDFVGGGFADGFAPAPDAGFGSLSTSEAGASEEPEEPMQPWELSINKLLDSDDENNKVAAELAAILPTLPLEGQVEAVQHMVNLTEDDKYSVASSMLLNPGTHPELREVLLADVLDRPNSMKLPVLLAVMAVPGHPLLAEAHRNLREVVGSDFGMNASAWSGPVQSLLAREADEEAQAEAEAEAQDEKTN